MTQWVKVFVTKPNDLGLIPRIHLEEENLDPHMHSSSKHTDIN